jgi:hypothetical protein
LGFEVRFSSRAAAAGSVTVADQAAMLASGSQPGQVAYREDTDATYVLLAAPASTLSNWKTIVTADIPVEGAARVGISALPDEVAALTEIPNLSPFLLSGM